MLARHIPLALTLAALVGCGSSDDMGKDISSGGTHSGTSGTPTTSTATTSWSGTGTGTTGTGTTGTGTGTYGGTSGTSPGTTSGTSTTTTTTTTSGGDTGDTGLFTTAPSLCAPVPTEVYLSPDDSNSYASAELVRYRVLNGFSPGAVRTYEFMNYYDFDYPAAPVNEVALYAEMVADATVPGNYTLQVAVASEARVDGGRAPINLTMVLDTSGSMGGAPMDMLVHSCLAMSAALDVGDTVSMVTWDTSNATVIDNHAVSGPNDAVLNSTCRGLVAGGGTNLSGGLVAGYQLAQQNWAVGQTNRIVLVSDGGANAGVTDVDLIAVNADRGDAQQIYLTGVGVGTQGYNDHLMDVVTDAGRGASVFVASEAEAWKMLNTQFLSTFEIAARDVRLRIDLPENLRIDRFSGQQLSGNPALVLPQYLAPNSEMVFFQDLSTVSPSCITGDTEFTFAVMYRDLATDTEQILEQVYTVDELLAANPSNLLKGRAVFLYAEALKAYNGTGFATIEPLALAALTEAEAAWPGDAELVEIRAVLNAL